ncbi:MULTISPECIES: TonB-dependent receptor domain-containing protein [unclassified Brevundimonas]|uniref:TonB-dependent receptor domain-containing protein n=1 Tax=unclassified Brevundimonas TaxID=2622653 RepID=UPI0025C32116|nr:MULTISPECIES: TonB-dependent receptor [unclassified Brevundimonas]
MTTKSLLVSVSVLSLVAGAAQAQSQSADPHDHITEVEEVVVRALPLGRSGDDIASHVSLLSGQDFVQRRTSTLGDSLSSLPGVNSDAFGGGASRPVIRGQTSPRVKVLSEGAGLIDASEVSPDHAVSGDPLLMEGVEILRGPSALLYGGGAIGGAVNLLDKKIPTRIPENGGEGVIEYRHGSVDNEDAGVVGVTVGAGQLAFRLEAVGRRTDDYRIPDSDEKRLDGSYNNTFTGTVGASWIGENGYLGAAFTQQKSTYGLAGHSEEFASCHPHGTSLHCGGHGHDHDDDDDHGHDHDHDHDHAAPQVRLLSQRVDVRGEWRNPIQGIERVRLRAGYTDYEHKEVEEGSVLTTFSNKGYDGRLEVQHSEWMGLRGVAGVQVSKSDFGAVGVESYLSPTETQATGLFLMEEYETGLWHLEAAIRKEWVETARIGGTSVDHDPLSVSASALWHFQPQWTLGLSLARSQRAPTSQELFARGVHLATNTYEIGTANLDLETVHSAELTLRKLEGPVTGLISVYHYDYQDYIFANTLDRYEDFRLIRYEQADAKFTGIDAELSAQLAPGLKATVYGDYVRAKLDDGGNLPRIPAGRLGARLSGFKGPWSGKLDYTHVFEQTKIADYEAKTPSYDLLSATVAYGFELGDTTDAEIYLRGTNLLDEKAWSHASFLGDRAPMRGRGVTAGVRVRF